MAFSGQVRRPQQGLKRVWGARDRVRAGPREAWAPGLSGQQRLEELLLARICC